MDVCIPDGIVPSEEHIKLFKTRVGLENITISMIVGGLFTKNTMRKGVRYV